MAEWRESHPEPSPELPDRGVDQARRLDGSEDRSGHQDHPGQRYDVETARALGEFGVRGSLTDGEVRGGQGAARLPPEDAGWVEVPRGPAADARDRAVAALGARALDGVRDDGPRAAWETSRLRPEDAGWVEVPRPSAAPGVEAVTGPAPDVVIGDGGPHGGIPGEAGEGDRWPADEIADLHLDLDRLRRTGDGPGRFSERRTAWVPVDLIVSTEEVAGEPFRQGDAATYVAELGPLYAARAEHRTLDSVDPRHTGSAGIRLAEEEGGGVLGVTFGRHRVQAAREAGIPAVLAEVQVLRADDEPAD